MDCRPKTVFSPDQTAVRHSDGVDNALRIKRLGFADVLIIADVAVAGWCERNAARPGVDVVNTSAEGRRRTYVFLGANAIDRDANVYGVAGYETIGIVAKHFEIPVYVFAERGKIRSENWGQTDRWNNWLTGDRTTLDNLAEKGIRIYKPLDDKLDRSLITKFVTEDDEWTPEQLAAYAKTSAAAA